MLRFLDENVDSVDHLEVLRVLSEAPNQTLDLAEVVARAQTTPVLAMRLEQRGLLRTEMIGATAVCRFADVPPETESLLKQLLQLYRERPVTLIKTVYARDRKDLKAFADAFRLRKEN